MLLSRFFLLDPDDLANSRRPISGNEFGFITPAIIIVSIVFSIGVLSASIMFWYYYPTIRPNRRRSKITKDAKPLEVVKYFSSDDESSILDLIQNAGYSSYQHELVKATNFSRMKVHRIVSKLINRGILEKDKPVKNSKISIVEWLHI